MHAVTMLQDAVLPGAVIGVKRRPHSLSMGVRRWGLPTTNVLWAVVKEPVLRTHSFEDGDIRRRAKLYGQRVE